MKNKIAWVVILLAIIGLIAWQILGVKDNSNDLGSDTEDIISFEIFKTSLFDCKAVSEYENLDWYNDFSNDVAEFDFFSPDEEDGISDKLDIKNISEVCYSDNGYVIALMPGKYKGAGFRLIRYDINTHKVELSKREDVDGGKDTSWYKNTHQDYLERAPEKARDVYKWFIAPDSFVVQEGNVLKMSGSLYDKGCSGEVEFEYSLESNYIRMLNRCLSCEGNSEKNCTQY